MERQYVNSSMITSIGYDSTSATLEIEFKNSGAIWQYFDVQENVSYYLLVQLVNTLETISKTIIQKIELAEETS